MAKVTNDLLDKFAHASWNSLYGGCLLDASGVRWQPTAVGSVGHDNAWTWTSAGSTNAYKLPEAVYNVLAAAPGHGGANSVGEFAEDVAGSVVWHWLGLDPTGGAVADLPSSPPPPPPP